MVVQSAQAAVDNANAALEGTVYTQQELVAARKAAA